MKFYKLPGAMWLLASLFPSIAYAQYLPDQEEDFIFPEISVRHVSTSATEAYSNYLEFSLDWSTGTLPRKPLPLASTQTQQPRWIYFWKFGDHTYSSDSIPKHAFPDIAGLNDSFEVEVSLKPIYSDDHDPFKKKKKKKVGMRVPGPPSLTDPPGTPAYVFRDTTYAMITNPDMAIELESNWRATHPDGVLTVAITIRPRSDSPVSGTIGFLYARNMLQVDTVEGDFGAGDAAFVYEHYQSMESLEGRSWRFQGLSRSSGERTIFVDVRAPLNIGQLIDDTSSIQFPVYAFIAYDDPQGGNTTNQQTLISRLIGASKYDSKGGNDPGIATGQPDSYNFYQEISEQMSINWASDPNYIHVEPAILSPGATNQRLRYSVHFQNDGSSLARNLAVRMPVSPLLDGAGAVQNPDSSNVPGCLQLFPNTNSLRWDTVNPSRACKLNGLGDAVALGFSTDSTWGRVHYDIHTKSGYTLRSGDTIRAQGRVFMDGTSKLTPVKYVPVITPAFCYPGILGLKYTQHFANDAVRSGWGLGLTLRYALGKVQNPNFEAHSLRRIRKNNFPLFWWQGELGYGQTSLRPGAADSLRLCHLDLTPVMLRFIARKPPLRFGSLTFERGWGISAGYTASYLLASRRNGADDTAFDQFGFGDRLDHSISLSADFLNLIGRPGISIGAGWRWRNSGITGTREWYQNAFVYLHYTFSPRFRTEFGWLK